MEENERIARDYFAAISSGTSAQERFYADDGTALIHGQTDELDKAGVVAYFAEAHGAMPDLRLEVLDAVAAGDRVTVHWRMTGTFAGPGTLNGLAPNGARVDATGVDVLTLRDGRIARNDAYSDGMTVARQLGLLPPRGGTTEGRLTRLTNVRAPALPEPEAIADGVWRLSRPSAGFLGDFAVYFVRDGDGVLMYDAGVPGMASAVRAAAARLGGLTRVVLGHGHDDHRGTAPVLGVPVLCHADEVVDAEGSGGWRYWDPTLAFLPQPVRTVHRAMHRWSWDGGPVTISGTLAEGDEVAGFRVVHLPGHAPGLIALWRESDRLALCSDAFYVTDMWGRPSDPHVPTAGYNHDTEQTRASLRKLAALEPAAAWPGHLGHVEGDDVRAQLERAADAPA